MTKVVFRTVLMLLSFPPLSFSKDIVSAPTHPHHQQRELNNNNNNNNNKDEGLLVTVADCPGKCLAYDDEPPTIELVDCRDAGRDKYWERINSCSDGDDGFFRLRNVVVDRCVSDPRDCASCDDKGVVLVDCDSDKAAWFSHGRLHSAPSSPRATYLYSTRCWLRDGVVSALATPSLESKTCPENNARAAGACRWLEWSSDRYSKDMLNGRSTESSPSATRDCSGPVVVVVVVTTRTSGRSSSLPSFEYAVYFRGSGSVS